MPPEGGHEQQPATRWLNGLWAAVPTPFREDGELDLPGIRHNTRHFAGALKLDGIFCNGLMGEIWSLDTSERQAALEAILDGAEGRLAVGVVVTHHSERETVVLARHAARAGAHHVVLLRPRAPLTHEELLAHVRTVAAAVPLPVVLFESPAMSMSFGVDAIERLSAEGVIAGVKVAHGMEFAARLRDRCRPTTVVADPHEENWLTNLLRFDLQVLYADPEPYLYQGPDDQAIRAYFQAWRRNDVDAAWGLHGMLEPLRRVYNRWILGPLNRGQAPNAALKIWCERMGLAAGPVRPPLKPLEEAERVAMLTDLATTGLLTDEPWPVSGIPGSAWRH